MESQAAQHLLRTIDEGQQFYFCNGAKARNLPELRKGILGLNKEQYHHHVYNDHNDFTNWLLDVIGDDQLGRDLFKASKQQASSLIRARIHFLEESAKKQA